MDLNRNFICCRNPWMNQRPSYTFPCNFPFVIEKPHSLSLIQVSPQIVMISDLTGFSSFSRTQNKLTRLGINFPPKSTVNLILSQVQKIPERINQISTIDDTNAINNHWPREQLPLPDTILRGLLLTSVTSLQMISHVLKWNTHIWLLPSAPSIISVNLLRYLALICHLKICSPNLSSNKVPLRDSILCLNSEQSESQILSKVNPKFWAKWIFIQLLLRTVAKTPNSN